MLAANSKCLPSAVTVLASLRRAHSAFCLAYASPAALNSATCSSVGLMITSPVIPFTAMISPSLTRLVISFVPRTAAISSVRAMIAEWLVRPPMFVTKALTNCLFNWAVSEGVKSCAITIDSSSIVAGFGSLAPRR